MEAQALVRKPGSSSYYSQLAQALRERINRGDIAPGERLPSETELAKMFGISRPVVRQALDLLEREEFVYRVQGRGTFVTTGRFRSRVMEVALGPESDTVRFRSRLRTRILRSAVEVPTLATARELGLRPGDEVVHLRRIRYFDNEPLAILDSRIPIRVAPGLELVDLTDQSLYEQLSARYGVRIAHLRRNIEATLLDHREAGLLQAAKSSPCLRVSSLATDAAGATIEVSIAIYRADKITLVTELDTSSGDFFNRGRGS